MYKLFLYLLLLFSCSTNKKESYIKKINIIHIDGGTFDMPLDIIITNDTQKALEYVKNNNDSTATIQDFDSRGLTYPVNNGRPPIVWIPKMDGSPEDISILNHELLHANISILTWAGLSLSDSTEEVYAYNYQYLTKQFYGKFK